MPPIEQIGTSRLEPTPAEQPAMDAAAPQQPVPPEPAGEGLTADQIDDLRQRIIAALCTCFDPEIPVNIYELGLIYDITIAPTAEVHVRMTLTTPACPAA